MIAIGGTQKVACGTPEKKTKNEHTGCGDVPLGRNKRCCTRFSCRARQSGAQGGGEVAARTYLIAAAFVMLAACQSPSPAEQQADAYEAEGRNQASIIMAEAAVQAKLLEDQASEIGNTASNSGGYTEKKLDVRADALRREAAIVKEQGEARADAVRSSADAKAKALRAR